MGKIITTNIFIERAKNIHDDKYDYSLVEYNKAHTKIKIICKKHDLFEQTPHNHINGKNGCPLCSSTYRKTKIKFIEEAKEKYGNTYDYSLVDYKNNETKIKIICKKHGEFEQTPNSHLSIKCGCPKCGINHMKQSKSSSTNEFIEKSTKIHSNIYGYSLINYINSQTKVKIICEKHGEFMQQPNSHLNNNGCPICKESNGEKQIRNLLDNNDIEYKCQKTFKNCKNIRVLPFDFYLPENKLCIEFDGKHHYKMNEFFGGEKGFKETQKRDKIKNIYCKENNIKLIRIKYNENIKEKLSKFEII